MWFKKSQATTLSDRLVRPMWFKKSHETTAEKVEKWKLLNKRKSVMEILQSNILVSKAILNCLAFALLSYLPDYLPKEINIPDEICDNALDDDDDGLIDLNDPDCACEVIEPVSLIPNPSFEEMDCCPHDRSQLDCASVWIQASEPTTDYIHMCGWMGWNDFPPPVPFPDGEGIMGFRDGRIRQNNGPDPERNWKEYAGACLFSPLEADSSYRFEFHVGFVNNASSPPINITFFGTTDCVDLPFGVGNDAFGCPTNGSDWVRLGSTLVSGGVGNKWVKTFIDVIPTENITAIAIGPDCPAVNSPVSTYYFFDNLILADFSSFELQIAAVSHPCQENFILKIPENTDFSYQWFKDGIALIGETSFQLTQMHGEGDYQVRIDDGMSCRLSVGYYYRIPIFIESEDITICEDETYAFGDQLLSETGMYVDTFKSINNCDSIIFLNLKVLGVLADTVSARIFEGESYEIDGYKFKKEGDHLITFTTSQGCDSLVLLQLEYYHIFIPNAFSPNEDGVNDLFSVFSEAGLIESSELTIFDRWGALVYEGDEWDGKYEGKAVNPGVYVYIVVLKMNDGIERQFSGEVTVVR